MGKVEYACLAFDIRLWKWLASSSPRLWKRLCNCVLRIVQLRLTVHGNGWQAVLPVYGNGCATMSYGLCNYVLRIVQLRLTVHGNGWQAVLPVYGNGCATMSYSLCNCVLRIL
jgi:hypothetical protein